ncbi:PREDICTED: phospholipase A2 [Ceratosolen solmsi marchali]|uniref:Phospholipase A2 n=1 Tax=Ceratosolen solmsi marchali TaxID=326594 RepID=A0AAJ6YHV9_9HYME|nr:PREDICTED: phospholipase A2 [Ceratosolen solmsi marchali]
MPRPTPLVRPRATDRWSRVRGAALVVLLLFLSETFTQANNTSNGERVIPEFISNNNAEKSSNILSNEIELDSKDDDVLYVSYSGYLRSNSSLLALRTKYHNFTNSVILSNKNETALDIPIASGHRRFKRAVTHLYNMIVCATGCNPLAYKGYGCYCGFLGSGYPMDGIDRCCKMHDWCYDATECPMFVEYFVPYYWKCYHGYKPICAIEHGEWGSSGSCAQRLCECDRSFAECLRKYRCPRHKAVCTSSPWRLIQNLFMII